MILKAIKLDLKDISSASESIKGSLEDLEETLKRGYVLNSFINLYQSDLS